MKSMNRFIYIKHAFKKIFSWLQTAKMQLAKQSVQDNPEDEDYSHMVQELKQE